MCPIPFISSNSNSYAEIASSCNKLIILNDAHLKENNEYNINAI